jgi:hypothetical protein
MSRGLQHRSISFTALSHSGNASVHPVVRAQGSTHKRDGASVTMVVSQMTNRHHTDAHILEASPPSRSARKSEIATPSGAELGDYDGDSR